MAEAETVTTPEFGIKVKSIERTLLPLVKQASFKFLFLRLTQRFFFDWIIIYELVKNLNLIKIKVVKNIIYKYVQQLVNRIIENVMEMFTNNFLLFVR